MFENSIMCDSLEGLYKSLEFLLGSHSSNTKLHDEYNFIVGSLADVLKDYIFLKSSMRDIITERDELRLAYESTVDKRLSFDDIRNKIIKSHKTTIKILEQDLENERRKREALSHELIEQEKQYNNTNSELNSLRQKISKQFKSSEAAFHMKKVCSNCSQIYTEETNYNWSCRTHLNKYNGENYWCCGAKDRNAPGCMSGKHVYKEDRDHDIHKGSLFFCSVKDI